MKITPVGLMILVLAVLAGGSDAQSQKATTPEEFAISCPANTSNRYAGLSGSVGCSETYSPVCQCTDDTRPMAHCELIEP